MFLDCQARWEGSEPCMKSRSQHCHVIRCSGRSNHLLRLFLLECLDMPNPRESIGQHLELFHRIRIENKGQS